MNTTYGTPGITPTQRFVRRAGAVALLVVLLLLGAGFMFLAATTGGRGSQVGPLMGGMVGVLFGFPMVASLVRNIQIVWEETR
jgi:hypothetical protein